MVSGILSPKQSYESNEYVLVFLDYLFE